MVTEAPADLPLTPINGGSHTLQQWLTTFHLVTAVLDPYTAESAWVLPTVTRIFRVYGEADCRVAIVVTCTPEEARQFLGPYAKEFLTFADPDRVAVKGFGLERLPALVHIRQDLSIAGASEGWDPEGWRAVTERLSRAMSWSRPTIPGPSDPAAFTGTPALG
ncbi:MAG TPA: hypothetical protein VMN58_11780 [Acidimicrobiales bacterium]|nr:hypothetical protein [Acidimicrobiales bacterium]